MLQELILSPRVTFYCGSKSLRRSDLMSALDGLLLCSGSEGFPVSRAAFNATWNWRRLLQWFRNSGGHDSNRLSGILLTAIMASVITMRLIQETVSTLFLVWPLMSARGSSLLRRVDIPWCSNGNMLEGCWHLNAILQQVQSSQIESAISLAPPDAKHPTHFKPMLPSIRDTELYYAAQPDRPDADRDSPNARERR
jgi:hypothetical protein